MITLALFEKMAADAVAGLRENVDFFWEEIPLQKNGKPAQGVWLVTRGGDATRARSGRNLRTIVDFYVALQNPTETEAVHSMIQDWISTSLGFCELTGEVRGIGYAFENVRIRPTTTPENAGATDNGIIVKVASAELIYDKKQ